MRLGGFAHRYWVCAIVLTLALAPILYFNAHGIISWLFLGGILFAYAVLLSVYLVLFGAFSYQRRYVRACSVLIGALILVLLALNWSFYVRQTRSIIDVVRFHLQRTHYLDIVKKTPEDTPRLIFFPWGWTGHFLSAITFYDLVYDESDEVALPANLRTPAWNANAAKKNRVVTVYESRCRSEVAHLETHFYGITTTCQ